MPPGIVRSTSIRILMSNHRRRSIADIIWVTKRVAESWSRAAIGASGKLDLFRRPDLSEHQH